MAKVVAKAVAKAVAKVVAAAAAVVAAVCSGGRRTQPAREGEVRRDGCLCGGADGTGFSWLDSRTDDGGGESVFGLHCAQETDETKC